MNSPPIIYREKIANGRTKMLTPCELRVNKYYSDFVDHEHGTRMHVISAYQRSVHLGKERTENMLLENDFQNPHHYCF